MLFVGKPEIWQRTIILIDEINARVYDIERQIGKLEDEKFAITSKIQTHIVLANANATVLSGATTECHFPEIDDELIASLAKRRAELDVEIKKLRTELENERRTVKELRKSILLIEDV